MSVIFIGDRSVGKSQLVYTLTSRQSQNVEVTNLTQEELEADPSFWSSDDTKPTDNIEIRTLEMKVRLRVPVRVKASWMDTPGEIWQEDWRQKEPNQWDKLKKHSQTSKGVILLLPPHRQIGWGIKDVEVIKAHSIPNQTQWCNRFQLWMQFFLNNCPNAEHIVVCINKADLFCDIQAEANKLAYNSGGLTMDWADRHTYIIDKYFAPLKSAIGQVNRSRRGLMVRCFITSIHNRSLLELPWLYLGSYL